MGLSLSVLKVQEVVFVCYVAVVCHKLRFSVIGNSEVEGHLNVLRSMYSPPPRDMFCLNTISSNWSELSVLWMIAFTSSDTVRECGKFCPPSTMRWTFAVLQCKFTTSCSAPVLMEVFWGRVGAFTPLSSWCHFACPVPSLLCFSGASAKGGKTRRVFIGASLSEPHTSVTGLRTRVSIYLAIWLSGYLWTDHLP